MEYLVDEKQITAKIIDIEWDRIFLSLTVEVEQHNKHTQEQLHFYLVNGLYQAKGEMTVVSVKDNLYHLQLNVTNSGDHACFASGTYQLMLCNKDKVYAIASATPEIIHNVDNYSRNFLFANRSRVFTITFFIDEDSDESSEMPLKIHMMPSSRYTPGFPVYGGLKKLILNIPKPFQKYFKNQRIKYRRHYRNVLKQTPPSESQKTVLFMTEQSATLGGNLQAVYDCMKARGMEQDGYQLLISARPASYEEQSRQSWFDLLSLIAKSDFIFLDDHAPIFDWLKLDAKTKLIQLWHAGAGFKSSGYSRWGHKGCPSPTSCHRQYAYGIAGSTHIIPFFSEVWGINDECVLPTGMPRMDEFLNADYREEKTKELYQQYPLCNGKKVMLFAPTYRGKNRADAYYPYQLIDFDKLYEECGDEYVVLFKMHPWVSQPVPIEEKYQDKFIDVGSYPNINDLFYITDLLVTDYSSNIFEYSLMKKPMLFFAFDKTEYSFSRGFHRPYEESAPGKVCYTFAELLKALQDKDFEYEKVEEYVEFHFDYIDTHASDRVIDWIILGQLPKKLKQANEEKRRADDAMRLLDFRPPEVIAEQEAAEEDED